MTKSNPKKDPLKALGVIGRLEVGPVLLKPRGMAAPYRVTKNGEVHENELIYRFEENVFVPDEPASLNLASMMAAQVALNYGLFCDELVFHGCFDKHDRGFIEEMAQNTAREIFVKKFLQPNPFLHSTTTDLPPVKLESYLRAKVVFPDQEQSKDRKDTKWKEGWKGQRNRHAVLSSGGKDSLLSFGLLRECGHEVHPIFVNESGRHWFTALNAYRYFAANIKNTARVWTNSDRLFSWMLKHLPFVRQDFSRIRSDQYPIRLWTVAVFLFGALPILRKRGVGRLLIGDEFDTTCRLSHGGIPHYDGLYDQSRFFDHALTRYFNRKGWAISQFSLLRPLSELLIQKILVERYPDLQRLQVSCHATHKEGERVHPCGRCEKCRRIVSMLMALGVDPSRCGYKRKQVATCLERLSAEGIHQESHGLQHLGFVLREKGLLTESSIGGVKPRQRPEIMKLRFDSEKSPLDDIPVDLRESLYWLYLEHGDGAVKKKGKSVDRL